MKATTMKEIFTLMWQFIRKDGFSKSEALKVAWRNYKLKKAMATRIVKFYFMKVSGEIREAYGSLAQGIIPATQNSGRKQNDSVQTYWDSAKGEWRSFRKANLLTIA